MNGRLLPRTDLSKSQRVAMLALMQKHFVGVTAGPFERDLSEKNWVVLLEDGAGRVRGFTTLLLYTTTFHGSTVRVVYSGDTIVDREAWGSTALARTWLAAVKGWLAECRTPLYWLLITSGFRTYRFLPVFWRRFWPRFEASMRPPLLDALARERFGERFDAVTGLVRLEYPQVLRNGLKEIPPYRLTDPDVRFFADANPGYAQGDELVCLCPLTGRNQTLAGQRLLML